MVLLQSVLVLGVAALLENATASALLGDGEFCENLSIIGGQPVTIEEAPYMVALQESAVVVCGGTIVNEKFVLTAASCISSKNVGRRIIVGTDRISDGGFIMDIEKPICHEEYDSKTNENDICLLKVVWPIPFDSKVSRVILPFDDYEVGLVNITGWGLTEEISNKPVNGLRRVTVPVVSEECCSQIYEGKEFSDNLICAGSHGHDACRGDSGGPITYKDVQIGIVSYGGGECGAKPGVYTKVASYMEWIDTTIQNNS